MFGGATAAVNIAIALIGPWILQITQQPAGPLGELIADLQENMVSHTIYAFILGCLGSTVLMYF